MKILFVFIVCCFAIVLGWSHDDENRVKEKAAEECFKELKLEDEDWHDAEKFYCICLCVHKKIGYLNADGSLNIRRIVNGHPNTYFREMVRKEYQRCLKEAEGDLCKTSFCFEEWYNDTPYKHPYLTIVPGTTGHDA